MDSLTTPKFKSKVEQFYYDHRAVSELDLASQEVFSGSESPQHGQEQRNITEARNRAYSGDGRKSYFTFENSDSRNSDFEKHGSILLQVSDYTAGIVSQKSLLFSHLWFS